VARVPSPFLHLQWLRYERLGKGQETKTKIHSQFKSSKRFFLDKQAMEYHVIFAVALDIIHRIDVYYVANYITLFWKKETAHITTSNKTKLVITHQHGYNQTQDCRARKKRPSGKGLEQIQRHTRHVTETLHVGTSQCVTNIGKYY